MTDTIHLGLPFIEASQAQKHVTHNESLRILDALVMLSVRDRDLSAPPGSPAEGGRYLVKATGSDAFAGHDDHLAHYADGGWTFYAPQAGWLAYVEDEGVLVAWDGSAWSEMTGGGGGGVAASATDVLTGTNTSKFVTADALAALWEKGADVATASTVTLGDGLYFNLTGTATVADIDWTTPKDGRIAFLRAQGDFTLTHSATLACPESADIAVKAGDILVVVQEDGDTVRVLCHQRKSYSDQVYAGVGALVQKAAPVPSADRLAIRDADGAGGKYITLEQAGTLARGVPGYYPGRYYGGDFANPSSTNSTTIVADTLYAIPFFVGKTATFTRIGVNITTGAAGNGRLGIFTAGSDGMPGTLVLDAGTVDTTSTGVKEISIGQTLEAGYYYLVAVFDSTPGLTAVATTQPLAHLLPGVSSPALADCRIQRSFTYAALSGASPFGTPGFSGSNIPLITLRIV